jgi:O-antigen ligase
MKTQDDGIGINIIQAGLIGLLIFSPLPAASVYEWSILVIEIVVLAMLGTYTMMGEKPQINELLGSVVHWPKRLFLLFFLFLCFQIVPLPKFFVHLLSPGVSNYMELYAGGISAANFLSFSIIPSFTLQRALELAPYFFLGFLVLKTVTRRHQIVRIYAALIGLGAFEAFYGLFELYSGSPRILFYRKIHNLDSVTGTFVNRNHLSGYLEMVIPLAIGLLISRIDLFALKNLTWRKKILRLSERGFAVNILLLSAVVLMSIAVIFSNSRSGVFILVLIFILFFGLTALFFDVPAFRKKRIRTLFLMVFIIILVIALYIGLDSVLHRFSLDKLLQEKRPVYWADALRMFADYPLFGTGLGTFGALAPPLEGEEGPLAIVHAHNDYLEYLSELGLIGSLLLGGGVLLCLAISFRAWRTRKNPQVKGLALGGIVSIAAILVHSLTDFNLHIPANMLLFAVILSLTMVTAFYQKTAAPRDEK